MGDVAPPLADGRYRLIDVLGTGGMATVYRSWDARLQVFRAIKVLSPALAKKRSLRKRFEAEASTMALLEHRNIVRVYDVAEDGDRIFIVMELVNGGSLLDRVKRDGYLPARLASQVTIDMLEALSVAHEHGVVHRDMKPHNVLLSSNGDLRITDFGIARAARDESEDDGMTKTGAVMGTWGFMAPEQRVDAKNVDARADIYSIGATLYAIMTAKTPVDLFAADMDASMMEALPAELAEIIKKATRYKRDERYPSVAAMASDLKLCLLDLPADPEDTPPLVLVADKNPPTRPVEEERVVGPGPMTLVPDVSDPGAEGRSDPEGPPLEPVPSGNVGLPLSATGLVAALSETPNADATWAPREPVANEANAETERMAIEASISSDESLPGLSTLPPEEEESKTGLVIGGLGVGALLLVGVLAVVLRGGDSEERVIPPVEPTPVVVAPVVENPAVTPAVEPPAVDPAVGPSTPDPVGTGPAVTDAPAVKPPVETPPVKASTGSTPKGITTAPEAVPSSGTTDKPVEAAATTTPDTSPAATLGHKAPSSASKGATLTIVATLPDDTWNVTLYHRPKGGSFTESRMRGSGGRFTAGVPITDAHVGGFEYYIKASPRGGGSTLTFKNGFSPQKVTVN